MTHFPLSIRSDDENYDVVLSDTTTMLLGIYSPFLIRDYSLYHKCVQSAIERIWKSSKITTCISVLPGKFPIFMTSFLALWHHPPEGPFSPEGSHISSSPNTKYLYLRLPLLKNEAFRIMLKFSRESNFCYFRERFEHRKVVSAKKNGILKESLEVRSGTIFCYKAKEKYRGMFEIQKSGDKTSSGEIGLDIRTHASPKVGQDQVSGGVSVLCWHMFYGNLAKLGKKSNSVIRSRSAMVKNWCNVL